MRILFVSTGDVGHFHPVVQIATTLVERGHTVAFATRSSFHETVRRAGFVALSLGFDEPEQPLQAESSSATAYNPIGSVHHLVTQAADSAPKIIDLAASWRADLMVRQGWRCCSSAIVLSWATWLAGAALQIPVALIDFGSWPSELLRIFAGDAFAQARLDLGLRADSELKTLDGPLRVLCAPPNWFPNRWLNSHTRLVQPPAYDGVPNTASVEAFHTDDRRPTVYANITTRYQSDFGLLQMLFDALSELDVNAILTVGDLLSSKCPAPPSRFTIERYIPQSLVMDRCHAVLTYGGYGTTMWALRTGIPLVCMPPPTGYYEATAARIVKLCAGVAISMADRSPKRIRVAVNKVLDRSGPFRNGARAVADSIASLPPVSSAAEHIERLSADHPAKLSW